MFTTKVYANMLAIQGSGRLDMDRLRRIVECKTVGEAFKMLGDYGYAYSDGLSVDGFIVNETNRLIEFVNENSPSSRLAEALNARFVYNNAKLAYKSRFIAVPSDGYYRTEPNVLPVADGDYSEFDPFMTEALTTLDEMGENRPQAIDLALTRAMYAYVRSTPIPMIKKYFTAEIDMKNILTAARMRRLKISGDEFIVGGKVSTELLEQAVTADGFAENFENTRYFEYAENIELGGFSELWRSELAADDHLYYLTDSEVASLSSYKPFLHYYTETLIELKTVKTALVCIKTNSRDAFYKRIPELYK